jgi:hypothetical protein
MAVRIHDVAICLVMGAALLGAGPATSAGSGASCEVGGSNGPVSLYILTSPERVQAFAASVKGVPVVVRKPATVVFGDGRVVTSDVESAGDLVNELGWGKRRIEIAASFGSRRAPRRRSFG